MHEVTTRLAGEHKGGRVTSNVYLGGPFHFPVFIRLQGYLKRCAVLSLAIMLVSTLSLLPLALCVRFVAVGDAETWRAWQQHQANANAAAEAAALQAMHEESTPLAGEHKGGRVTSNFYLERTAVLCKKVRCYSFLCLYVICVFRGTAVLCKNVIDCNFLRLYVKCTWNGVLFRR